MGRWKTSCSQQLLKAIAALENNLEMTSFEEKKEKKGSLVLLSPPTTSAAVLFFTILFSLQVYLILLFFSVAAVSILYFCIVLELKCLLLFHDARILSLNCENDLCVALRSKGTQSCILFCQPRLLQVVMAVMSLSSTCTLHNPVSANTTLALYALYFERVLAGIKFSHSGQCLK